MLDKQFFQDEQFHPYLTQNFILFRAHRGQPEGDEIYKKFSVRATPTVLFAMADGREIDRILGYGGKPGEFKDSIEETYKGENTLLNLNQAYEKDTSNIVITTRLAKKYLTHRNFDKLSYFSGKILKQPEKARQVRLPIGKDKAEVSAYEFAKYAATYSGPEQVLEFANEFPASTYLPDVFGNFGRSLFRKDTQEKALEVFDELIKKYPDSPELIRSYISFSARSKTNIDRGIKLADHLYKAKEGNVDLGFALSYADLLIEKGETKKIQKIVEELSKNNPDMEKEIRMQLGFLYQGKKKYDMAFETFESLIKDHPDHYPALYQIGRTAAYSGTNLDAGIKSLEKYLQHEPEEGEPTLFNAHWRLGLDL